MLRNLFFIYDSDVVSLFFFFEQLSFININLKIARADVANTKVKEICKKKMHNKAFLRAFLISVDKPRWAGQKRVLILKVPT